MRLFSASASPSPVLGANSLLASERSVAEFETKTQPQTILWLSSEDLERGARAWWPALLCLQGLWTMRRLLARRRNGPRRQSGVPAALVGLGWRSLSCGGVALFSPVLFDLPMSTVHHTSMQALNRELVKLCSHPPQQALSVWRLHGRRQKAL
jgi:hypothetical protein